MKKILILLSGLAVIAAIAVGILLYNINPILERFKPQITAKISEAIKNPVSLGELSVRFFPSVAIEVSDVALVGSEAASVKSLMLSASLVGLLTGNVSVDELELKDANLVLTKEKNGRLHLGGVELSPATSGTPAKGTASSESAGASTASTPPAAAEKADSKLAFAIQSAVISNLNLIWEDNSVSPAQKIEIKNLSIDVEDLDLGGGGSFDLTATLLGKSADNIALKGTLNSIDKTTKLPSLDATLALNNLDLDKILKVAKAYGVTLKDVTLQDSLSINIDAKSVTSGLNLGVTIDADKANIAYGKAFSKPSGETFRLATTTSVNPIRLEGNAEKLELRLGDIVLNAPVSFSKSGPGKLKVTTDRFSLDELGKFVTLVAPYSLSGNLNSNLAIDLGSSGTIPPIDGTLTLKNVGAQLALAKDAKPLVISDFSGPLTFDGKNMIAKGIALKVAGQELNIGANITNLATPNAAFNITSPKLKLFPILSAFGPGNESMQSSYIDDVKLVGTYGVKSGSGNVTLTTGTGNVSKVPLGAINLKADITPRLITLKPSKLSLFGGSLDLQGDITQGDARFLRSSLKASGIDVAAMMAAVSPAASVTLRGTLESLTSNVKADLAHFIPSATGSNNLQIVKGAIVGFNIVGQTLGGVTGIPGLGSALAKYIPEEHQGVLQDKDTGFDVLYANTSLGGGNLNISKFALEHTLYIIDGDGSVKLTGGMDIKARLKLTSVMTEAMVLREPKLKLLQDPDGSIVVPIRIKQKPGGRPLVIPDTEDLAKRALKSTAREAATRALDKVAPGLGGAGKAIEGLFGG